VYQGLAAGDRDDRSAAFVDGGHAFFRAQASIENLFGIIDFAAAGAR